MTTQTLEYSHDGTTLEAFIAKPEGDGPFPTVLICHAWAGRADHEEEVAKKLASLGYVGVALDVYGKGVLGQNTEECNALMTPFVEDRARLQDRLKAGLAAAASLPFVDSEKVVVSGYCFGGLCALDMARSNTAIKGAASFHGLFFTPSNIDDYKITAKVIAFHGWDDPMAKPEDVVAFGAEMAKAEADWQLHAYGGTMHAFTNKAANDPDFGTVYSPIADERSWQAFENFLSEVLAA